MKRFYFISVLSLLLLATSCNDAEMPIDDIQDPNTDAQLIPMDGEAGQLLIKFRPEMSEILDGMPTRSAAGQGAATRCNIPTTDEVLALLKAYSLERIFPIDVSTEERTRKAGLHLWYKVTFDPSISLQDAARQLSALGEVSKVQANPRIKRASEGRISGFTTTIPSAYYTATRAASHSMFNDPGLARQWHYVNTGDYPFARDWAPVLAGADVGCEEAWKLCTGDSSIIVAVLDEGVMYTHPDLAANMWVNPKEHPNANCDADGNGYKDDRYGYNFVMDNGSISWSNAYNTGHGTHVAGTIAAVNNNGIGVSGIAGGTDDKPGVRIMSCQVFDGGYGVTLAQEAKAIKYAADNGAVILQCSWGYNSAYSNPLNYTPGPASEEEWEELYPLEKEALDYFINNAGSPNGVIDGGVAIFASGNEYAPLSAFPGAYHRCVTVGAIAADYTPSTYSNYGPEVDLSAPGGDNDYHGLPGHLDDEPLPSGEIPYQGSILSTAFSDGEAGYAYMEGTSMACPHVSGVAALALSYAVQKHRHFTADEFVELMKSTATELDPYFNGVKNYYFNHTLNGSSFTSVELSKYRGRMGRLINAGALLHAIENGGRPMVLPNVTLTPGVSETIVLSKYYTNLSGATAVSANPAVATSIISDGLLIITGVSVGQTRVTVTVGGVKKEIVITVCNGTNGPV